MDSGADGSLMPFKIFKTPFPKSTIEALHSLKNNGVALKTYNNSNIEQLDFCSVKLRLKDKVTRCRFLVVLGDSPAWYRTPDIELLDILKIICEVVEGQQVSRKSNSQQSQLVF